MKKLNSKTGLSTGIIDDEVFNRELLLCKQLSNENKGGCCWGKCKECGVVPFIYKLHKGELLEGKGEISKLKKELGII